MAYFMLGASVLIFLFKNEVEQLFYMFKYSLPLAGNSQIYFMFSVMVLKHMPIIFKFMMFSRI